MVEIKRVGSSTSIVSNSVVDGITQNGGTGGMKIIFSFWSFINPKLFKIIQKAVVIKIKKIIFVVKNEVN